MFNKVADTLRKISCDNTKKDGNENMIDNTVAKVDSDNPTINGIENMNNAHREDKVIRVKDDVVAANEASQEESTIYVDFIDDNDSDKNDQINANR